MTSVLLQRLTARFNLFRMTTPGVYKCSCQNCDEHLEYPADYEGTEIACPHCGQGTLLQQPEAAATRSTSSTSAAPAPPAMGSHGRASDMPLSSEKVTLGSDDPLEDAVPQDMLQSADAADKDEPDPFTCENCGAAMMPVDKVCVECGDRRATVSSWSGTAIFRLVAGIVLGFELLVLGLQWTTTGKPFGLRNNARHAVKVKFGLAEEIKPGLAATKNGDTNGSAGITPVVNDPDLVLAQHALKPDKNNGTLWIHGTVKNISQYRYLAVKVNFDLKDSANSVIPGAGASAYVQSIEPGKEWGFKVLLVDPDATGYEPILPVEGYR